MRASLVTPAAFLTLLLVFIALRRLLLAIPGLDAWDASGIGTVMALALLLTQPFVCGVAARPLGAPRSAVRRVFGAGVLSSTLLLFPALVLFME